MSLSDRERMIYTMLSGKVRGVGQSQLLRALWPQTSAGRINGKRWISEQARLGLLETFSVLGRPVDDVELVYRGDIDIPPPDYAELSRESCRRWESIPPEPITVIQATDRLRNIFGGPEAMRFRALGQVGHDLGTGMIYLRLLRDNPEFVDGWMNEDEIEDPAFREAKADAVIFRDDGTIDRVIEFASGYQVEKFTKIDRTFRPHGIPYEVYMPC